jgi:hypothetical protein
MVRRRIQPGIWRYLASHKIYFSVLEALPVMPPFILFNAFHPGRIAKGSSIKRIIDARQPGVLLEGGLKNGGDGPRMRD